jgi:hypothetical protein
MSEGLPWLAWLGLAAAGIGFIWLIITAFTRSVAWGLLIVGHGIIAGLVTTGLGPSWLIFIGAVTSLAMIITVLLNLRVAFAPAFLVFFGNALFYKYSGLADQGADEQTVENDEGSSPE